MRKHTRYLIKYLTRMVYGIKVLRIFAKNRKLVQYVKNVKYTVGEDRTYPLLSYSFYIISCMRFYNIHEVRKFTNKIITRGDTDALRNTIVKAKIINLGT